MPHSTCSQLLASAPMLLLPVREASMLPQHQLWLKRRHWGLGAMLMLLLKAQGARAALLHKGRGPPRAARTTAAAAPPPGVAARCRAGPDAAPAVPAGGSAPESRPSQSPTSPALRDMSASAAAAAASLSAAPRAAGAGVRSATSCAASTGRGPALTASDWIPFHSTCSVVFQAFG